MSNIDEAPFAFPGLDRAFHEKARLGIVSSLCGHAEGLLFSELKQLCGLTDGNLSRHLQVLEQAGYLLIEKTNAGRRSQTRCRLSGEGQARFTDYLRELEEVLRRAAAHQLPGGPALVS
ncbi:ArsR family transcriptional regulator [Mangrovimicrobium sediminis]|uniref:ArsR family transcriptional regulator n=1 Tax=Mangrovimicrobium sediminis TaxID=2562682 RepID=A0A4Z0LTM6_9GAMM|nr:transcriptional regulator [Haliea sp. SAOS-164]TGD70456.1 ArsR family transcriptional regulator [Haliea sp. SAOS-164]